MNWRSKIVFALLSLLVLSLCFSINSRICNSEGDILSYLRALEAGDMKAQHEAIMSLHKMGKEAIPVLISRIDSGADVQTGYINPMISTLDTRRIGSLSLGEACAYIVELILGRPGLSGNAGDEVLWVLGNDWKNYVYSYGMIYKGGVPVTVGDLAIYQGGTPVTVGDLHEIRKAYERWWAKSKGLSIEKLRSDWRNNTRPLTNTVYYWE
jgi:hypothetical protein